MTERLPTVHQKQPAFELDDGFGVAVSVETVGGRMPGLELGVVLQVPFTHTVPAPEPAVPPHDVGHEPRFALRVLLTAS